MPTPIHEVLRHLRQAFQRQDEAELTDGQLLGRFLEHRDEAAVAALVRRHGPMVWGVCRRILPNHHDAEDAFQATFLVLVRKAGSVRQREKVGNWLYGVAHQTAMKARATSAKRRLRERQVAAMPEIEAPQMDASRDLRLVLDQELSLLPEKYRIAIVLCDLEGKTRKEAARHLGLPEGTLAGRLSRGRNMLAKRLARSGVVFSGGSVAVVVSENAASASVPASVMASTIETATLVAKGKAVSAGAISAKVAALTEGMVKTMLVAKLKIATAVLLALTVSVGSGLLYKTRAAGRPDDAPRAEQKGDEDLRAAAIKALEQFGKSEQTTEREAAIKALVDFRRNLKATEEARRCVSDLAGRFKFRIPVQIGFTESKAGGRIDIVEVWGTRPKIEIGGQYLVRGKYALPSHERGKLYFYLTADNWNNSGAEFDLQSTEVRKGQGEFTLLHGMAGPGFLHLTLLADDGKRIANVYFGTDDKALRYRP